MLNRNRHTSPDALMPCGTRGAYRRHRRRDEECDVCRKANRAAAREREKRILDRLSAPVEFDWMCAPGGQAQHAVERGVSVLARAACGKTHLRAGAAGAAADIWCDDPVKRAELLRCRSCVKSVALDAEAA